MKKKIIVSVSFIIQRAWLKVVGEQGVRACQVGLEILFGSRRTTPAFGTPDFFPKKSFEQIPTWKDFFFYQTQNYIKKKEKYDR